MLSCSCTTYGQLLIVQSIFRSASRREKLGKHSKGSRRDGELKMDWTKPLPERDLCVLIAGWISGEDLNGPEAVNVGDCRDGSRGLMDYHGLGEQHLCLGKCSQ
jgi:hypothetical protein